MRWIIGPALVLAWGGIAAAQSMSDQDVTSLISNYERQAVAARRSTENGILTFEEETKMADAALAGVELKALTPTQLWLMAERGMLWGSRRVEGLSLLKAARDGKDGGSALAALGYVSLLTSGPHDAQETAEAFHAALTHPGLSEAVHLWTAHSYFPEVGVLVSNRAVVLDNTGLDDLAAIMRLNPGLALLVNLDTLLQQVEQLAERKDADIAHIEAFRVATLGAIRACRGRLDDRDEIVSHSMAMGNRGKLDDNTMNQIRSYAAGKLQTQEHRLEQTFGQRAVGKPAPGVMLKWIVGRTGESPLDEEKGHAVVLVNWYRFPAEGDSGDETIKLVAERYARKPVTVVALTEYLAGKLMGTNGTVVDPGGTHEQQDETIREAAKARLPASVLVAIVNHTSLTTELGVPMTGNTAVIDMGGVVRAIVTLGGRPEQTYPAIDAAIVTESYPTPQR